MYLEAYVNSASKSMNFTTGNSRETFFAFKGLANGPPLPKSVKDVKKQSDKLFQIKGKLRTQLPLNAT